jgi:hypothetical protein
MPSRRQQAFIAAAIPDRGSRQAIDIQIDVYIITQICDSLYD